MKNYSLINKFPGGTSLKGYITTSYKKLVEILGEPNGGTDGYKVSTEWRLEDEKGNVVTLYDYKETNLYDESLPNVQAFRGMNKYDWHVGAKDEQVATDFISWLSTKL